MIEKNLKKRTARDFLAIGSWVFYALVLARSLVGFYRPFIDQMIIAGIFLIIASFLSKKFDQYSANTIVLLIFTTLFYKSSIFTAFAILIGVGVAFSSIYEGSTWRSVIFGIFVGMAAVALALFWTLLKYGTVLM